MTMNPSLAAFCKVAQGKIANHAFYLGIGIPGIDRDGLKTLCEFQARIYNEGDWDDEIEIIPKNDLRNELLDKLILCNKEQPLRIKLAEPEDVTLEIKGIVEKFDVSRKAKEIIVHHIIQANTESTCEDLYATRDLMRGMVLQGTVLSKIEVPEVLGRELRLYSEDGQTIFQHDWDDYANDYPEPEANFYGGINWMEINIDRMASHEILRGGLIQQELNNLLYRLNDRGGKINLRRLDNGELTLGIWGAKYA